MGFYKTTNLEPIINGSLATTGNVHPHKPKTIIPRFIQMWYTEYYILRCTSTILQLIRKSDEIRQEGTVRLAKDSPIIGRWCRESHHWNMSWGQGVRGRGGLDFIYLQTWGSRSCDCSNQPWRGNAYVLHLTLSKTTCPRPWSSPIGTKLFIVLFVELEQLPSGPVGKDDHRESDDLRPLVQRRAPTQLQF